MLKVTVFLLLTLTLLMGCSKDQSDEIARLTQENNHLKMLVGPPPASLDSLYPPKAPAPVYLIKMFEMATPFSGFIMKMNEGDRQAAKTFFDAFRAKYLEVSMLVPEWENAYLTAPLDELEALIEQGAPEKVMEAVAKVGKNCHDCHLSAMPKVQFKYHWDEFSRITVSDPISKTDLEFAQFMMSLEMSFSGIGIEMQQGQVEKAYRHFENFKNGFNELKGTCKVCHVTERKYFVDAEVEAFINQLGKVLKSSPPDMAMFGKLSEQIGMESCGKCHLVHIPATYAKASWKEH